MVNRVDQKKTTIKEIIKDGRDKYIHSIRREFDNLFKAITKDSIDDCITVYSNLIIRTNQFNTFISLLRNDLLKSARFLEKESEDEQNSLD